MKLSEYIGKYDVNVVKFAKSIGRAPSTVYRIINGDTTPDAPTIRIIMKMTGNKVMPNDFFDCHASR